MRHTFTHKWVSMLTTASAVLLAVPAAIAEPGDVNLDGAVNGVDRLLLQRYLTGQQSLSAEQMVFADVYPAVGDGQVTIADLLVLERGLTGLAELAGQAVDSDGDGMRDSWETQFGLNPNDPADADGDPDGDGLTNRQEHDLNGSPLLIDTDGDGAPDIGEYRLGSGLDDSADLPPWLGLYEEGFETADPEQGEYDIPAGWFVPAEADNGWERGDTGLTINGNFNLRAGFADDAEQSVVVLPVWTEEAELEFWRRTSADSGDGLEVRIDGDLVYSAYGLDGYEQVGPIDLTEGYHEIRFAFVRDASGRAYTNTVWLDALKITPDSLDSDGDTLPDIWESQYGLDASDPSDGAGDADSDGLTNVEEFNIGIDPTNPDVDGDSLPDGWEVDAGLDPQDPTDFSADADGDGIPARGEWALGTDPNDDQSVPADMTGWFESFESDPDPAVLPAPWYIPTSSDQVWRRDGVPAAWDGVFSIRPNGLQDSQRASVIFPVYVQDSRLDFGRRLSNDDGDGLEVWLDGVRVYRETGLAGWADRSVPLLAGYHELRFDFAKDASGKEYGNTLWLDDIRIVASDIDVDNDGMEDQWEIANGLNPADPADALLDGDTDGLNNRAEYQQRTNPQSADTDGDGLSDGDEVNLYATSPVDLDTDFDGVGDGDELANGFDPLNGADVQVDTDGDGLGAYGEVIAGTDPDDPDSDNDLMPDGWEVDGGLNPLNAGDGGSDNDADGFTAYEEYRLGTLPNEVGSYPVVTSQYSESFESGVPANWYDGSGSAIVWAQDCTLAADGSCSLRAPQGSPSSISFMARFPAGDFSFAWRTDTAAQLRVLIDGIEVFAAGGTSANWSTESIALTEGVHELSFVHDTPADGEVYIDDLGFLTTEIGLYQRPVNTACVAPPTSRNNVALDFEYPYPEAVFDYPTGAFMAPGDDTRWYVLEQGGLLKVFDVDNPAGVRTWLDFSGNIRADGEMGLLSMEFDPDFPTVPEIYVTYVDASPDSDLQLVRIILDDVDFPVNVTEQLIMEVDQDTAFHQGGDIGFGPDGYLYFGVGDDNENTYGAQSTTTLYGAMLRIDVRGVPWPSPGYVNPPGNAFAAPTGFPDFKCGQDENVGSVTNCPEIFAWGFRNPWRWSFDQTGTLWAGDVGDSSWEEVNQLEVGNNYGWNCLEAEEGADPDRLPPVCSGPFTDAVIAYPHEDGNTAVIGGFVYRGTELSGLQGAYIYGDLGSGRIWALRDDGEGGYTNEELWVGPQIMTSFSEGPDNELYYTNLVPGQLVKLVEAEDDGGPVFEVPTNLADTGCVDPDDPTQPSASMIPYDVHAKLWSDAALKNRALAIPDGTTITINGEDDFEFPLGSVLYKDFWLNGRIIETRLLMRRADGDQGAGVWEGFSYEWDEDQDEATLVPGKVVMVEGQEWTYPTQAQCGACHTTAAGDALGPETAGLNWDIFYPATGNTANQMQTLDAIGMFDRPLGDVSVQPSMPDPYDVTAPIEDRARAYLHANCSHCHRPGTGNSSSLDWRYQVDFADTGSCDVVPGLGDLGLGPDARLIKPGDSAQSVIIERMTRRGSGQMPPLATAIADPDGLALVSAWIDSLQSCGP